MNTLEN
jgi:hypothetical protein